MSEHTATTPDGRVLELAALGAEIQALGELVLALAATASPGSEAIALLACDLHCVAEKLEVFACVLVQGDGEVRDATGIAMNRT